MMQLPTACPVTTCPDTVQNSGIHEVSATGRPEVALTVIRDGAPTKSAGALPKAIDWKPFTAKDCTASGAASQSTSPACAAWRKQLPGASAVTVRFGFDTEQIDGVRLVNDTGRPELAVATTESISVTLRPSRGAKLIVCEPLTMVIVKACVASGARPLAAMSVRWNVPTAVGVPEITPVIALSVSPAGSVPLRENVGAGFPDAVAVKVPWEPTVNWAFAALVMAGAWGESTGCRVIVPRTGFAFTCTLPGVASAFTTSGTPPCVAVIALTPAGSVTTSVTSVAYPAQAGSAIPGNARLPFESTAITALAFARAPPQW